MIEAVGISKAFGKKIALNGVSMNIDCGKIYGLVGSNGSGKSTLLRVLSGVYRADGGSLTLDGKSVFYNPESKAKIAYVPDDLYFPQGSNLSSMCRLYKNVYRSFDTDLFTKLAKNVELPFDKNINTFSKGMKRQASTILALSVRTEYLLLDETFDGLDPVMRKYVKAVISDEMLSRGSTAVITSHSLRELEDTCDNISVLHSGDLLLHGDTETIRTKKVKVQAAFSFEYGEELFANIEHVYFEKHGSVCNLILTGNCAGGVEKIKAMSPVILDVLPLTLEELFSYELKERGYCFNEE